MSLFAAHARRVTGGSPAQSDPAPQPTPGSETENDAVFNDTNTGTPTPDSTPDPEDDNTDPTYPMDDDDDLGDDPDDGDSTERDAEEVIVMGHEITQLVEASMALESYGASPAAIAICRSQGLLTGTAMESMGMEALTGDADSESTKEVSEGLIAKAKRKAGEWAARVMAVARTATDKVIGAFKSGWDYLSGGFKKLGGKAWDMTKAAGRKIKAHPYATAAAVVSMVVATAGVVTFAAGSFPAMAAGEGAMASFGQRMAARVTTIRNPFGKITLGGGEGAAKGGGVFGIFRRGVKVPKGAPEVATAEKLGWTRSAANSLAGSMGRAWSATAEALGGIKDRFMRLISPVTSRYEDYIGHPGKVASEITERRIHATTGSLRAAKASRWITGAAYVSGIISMTSFLIGLVRSVVSMSIGVLRSCFGGLNHNVADVSGDAPPAAA